MKIFYTCPSDRMAIRLHHQFGTQISCYQNLGGLFNFKQSIWADSLYLECASQPVKEIYFVGSLQNRFVKSVLENEVGYGSSAEQEFARLYIQHFDNFDAFQSLQEKQLYLMMSAYKKQRQEIMEHHVLRDIIQQNTINIGALILMNNELYRFELLETVKR
ncbi:hypothetical protein [Negadavirga shengliensis]|uniref:Uncharacterized protein n=1 Tax=Negadavirga shengliensis TaxID=1389218 RepID=A0ABV9T924_9BACT